MGRESKLQASAAKIASKLERSSSAPLRRWAAPIARKLADARPTPLPWRVRDRLFRFAAGGPGRVRVYGAGASGRQAWLVTHDLSLSGAPKLVVEIATLLAAKGWAVTVLSPTDGPFRAPLVAAGAVVIVAAELIDRTSTLLTGLVRSARADVVICNTVNADAAVLALARHFPTLWYIHEVSLLRQRLNAEPEVARALSLPRLIWAGSELPAAILRGHRADVSVAPYGLDPIGIIGGPDPTSGDRRLRIGLFGSVEPRKGQDLAVAALTMLPDDVRGQIRLCLYGRELDPAFAEAVRAAAAALPEASFGGELGPDEYRRAMLECDAVLVSSRDDTLPLVSLDALGAGLVLMCTPTTGTAAALAPGVSGFVASESTADGIAAMLAEAVARRTDWRAIGFAGRAVFNARFSKDAFALALDGALQVLTAGSHS